MNTANSTFSSSSPSSFSSSLTYGYAVYVFPKNLSWFETGFYLKHVHEAVGFAEYVGEFPPARIHPDVLAMFPESDHDYITSPRTWDANGKRVSYGALGR